MNRKRDLIKGVGRGFGLLPVWMVLVLGLARLPARGQAPGSGGAEPRGREVRAIDLHLGMGLSTVQGAKTASEGLAIGRFGLSYEWDGAWLLGRRLNLPLSTGLFFSTRALKLENRRFARWNYSLVQASLLYHRPFWSRYPAVKWGAFAWPGYVLDFRASDGAEGGFGGAEDTRRFGLDLGLAAELEAFGLLGRAYYAQGVFSPTFPASFRLGALGFDLVLPLEKRRLPLSGARP